MTTILARNNLHSTSIAVGYQDLVNKGDDPKNGISCVYFRPQLTPFSQLFLYNLFFPLISQSNSILITSSNTYVPPDKRVHSGIEQYICIKKSIGEELNN